MAFVIDTSAFIIGAHKNFTDELKTTFQVIKELDGLKENPRTRRRQLDQLQDIDELLDEGLLHIDMYEYETTDISVIEIATDDDIILTTDTQLYLRQKILGKKCELLQECHPEHVTNPVKDVYVDKDLSGKELEVDWKMPKYTYVKLSNGISTRLGKYVGGKIEYIDKSSFRVGDIKVESKCMEQTMLIDQLLDIRIPLVTVIGPAGSGKTFITLQSALYLVEKGLYGKIIVQVPPVQLGGKDRYGYLPGSLEEKTIKQFSGIIDNLETLLGKEAKLRIEAQIKGEDEIFEIQSFQNIRGRSIKNQIIIVDESQNTDPLELKTFLTRVDLGSKIILLGDVEQIDIKNRSLENNGLLHVADKMYDSDVQTNIVLTKTYRSQLAEEQINRL